MSKKALWAEVLIFLVFIGGFFLANLIVPDRTFSEQENRQLQTLPEFSFERLFNKTFTTQFEDYTSDQFVLRDEWITLKAASELALGKMENNDMFLCGGDTMIETYTAPDDSKLESNIEALNALVENTDAEVYFALIPGKSDIWSGMLPKNAPRDSEKEAIDYCYSLSNANNIDIYSALEEHSDEYIYYRTDHHWTTLGAYYGFSAIAGAMGLDCPPIEDYTGRETISEEFYGTSWSSSGFSWVEPDSMEIFVTEPDGLKITNYPQGSPVEGQLYDWSRLEIKDKYTFFYGGNTPLLEIETGVEDAPSLLIIRDSYMDSLSPFLLSSYSKINILDLRYYRASLSSYIEENGFDEVLVCYSMSNFSTDSNIFLLGR